MIVIVFLEIVDETGIREFSIETGIEIHFGFELLDITEPLEHLCLLINLHSLSLIMIKVQIHRIHSFIVDIIIIIILFVFLFVLSMFMFMFVMNIGSINEPFFWSFLRVDWWWKYY